MLEYLLMVKLRSLPTYSFAATLLEDWDITEVIYLIFAVDNKQIWSGTLLEEMFTKETGIKVEIIWVYLDLTFSWSLKHRRVMKKFGKEYLQKGSGISVCKILEMVL